jgi:hypothetical protein
MNKNNPALLRSQNTQVTSTKTRQQRTVASVRTNASSAQVSSAHAHKVVSEKTKPKVQKKMILNYYFSS